MKQDEELQKIAAIMTTIGVSKNECIGTAELIPRVNAFALI
jgi:hypothetical protein